MLHRSWQSTIKLQLLKQVFGDGNSLVGKNGFNVEKIGDLEIIGSKRAVTSVMEPDRAPVQGTKI